MFVNIYEGHIIVSDIVIGKTLVVDILRDHVLLYQIYYHHSKVNLFDSFDHENVHRLCILDRLFWYNQVSHRNRVIKTAVIG